MIFFVFQKICQPVWGYHIPKYYEASGTRNPKKGLGREERSWRLKIMIFSLAYKKNYSFAMKILLHIEDGGYDVKASF